MATNTGKPEQSLLSACLAYVAHNLHVEIIKYSLFLIPKRQLLSIKDKMQKIGCSCNYTEKILKAVEDKSIEIMKPSTWEDFIGGVLTNTTIQKCAVIYSTSVQESTTLLAISQNFDISKEETKQFCNRTQMTYGSSNSITMGGVRYILFSQHPAMSFGKSVKNDIHTTENLCCLAEIKAGKIANTHQREKFVLIGIVESNDIMDLYEMQLLGADLTSYSRYLAEYYAYIEGKNVSSAASEFV